MIEPNEIKDMSKEGVGVRFLPAIMAAPVDAPGFLAVLVPASSRAQGQKHLSTPVTGALFSSNPCTFVVLRGKQASFEEKNTRK